MSVGTRFEEETQPDALYCVYEVFNVGLEEDIKRCQLCPISATKRNYVIGRGMGKTSKEALDVLVTKHGLVLSEFKIMSFLHPAHVLYNPAKRVELSAQFDRLRVTVKDAKAQAEIP